MRQRTTGLQSLAKWWIILLVVLTVGGDFIANDRPLVARVDGTTYFPVFRDYGTDLGLAAPYPAALRRWRKVETDWAWWPPVPYSAGSSDLSNRNYRSPFGEQDTRWSRHWLGTDALGRDTLAGLIRGTRTAVLVGLGAALVSLLLALPLGGLAGYFGNSGRGRAGAGGAFTLGSSLAYGFSFVVVLPYVYVAFLPYLRIKSWWLQPLLALAIALGSGWVLTKLFNRVRRLRRPVAFPLDSFVLQLIELFTSLPALVILIALVGLVREPSLAIVTLTIGILGWPVVARFVRAELLRIRSLPYVEAAVVSGLPPLRILWKHALPNAVGPLLVVLAFDVGANILLEASLSFLGIGIPPEEVTWGSLLRQARNYPGAWWLALFPGLFLTLTVLAANVWRPVFQQGDALQRQDGERIPDAPVEGHRDGLPQG